MQRGCQLLDVFRRSCRFFKPSKALSRACCAALPLRGEAASFPLSDLFLLKKAGMRLRLHRMFIHRKSEQKSTQGERRRQTSVFNAGAAIPCSAGARGRRAAQRPSGPAAQRPSGPAAQRPSGPAAQRPSGPAAQRPSGPAAQRPSGPAAQRPSGPAAQRPSGPAAQRPSGPAAQRPSGPTSPQVPSTGIRHGQGPLFLGTRAFFLGRGRCKAQGMRRRETIRRLCRFPAFLASQRRAPAPRAGGGRVAVRFGRSGGKGRL